MQEAILLVEDSEVESRLAFYELEKELLIEVARRAVAASRDATNNHPSNATGILSYIYGTQALRDLFLGKIWVLDRKDGIESIFNPEKNVKVVFQNVDIACSTKKEPKPRSEKGAGSERACSGNQMGLFPYLPKFVESDDEESVITLYLMVSNVNGKVGVELSRPIVTNGTFSSFAERILINDDLLDDVQVDLHDQEDHDDSIEIVVTRK